MSIFNDVVNIIENKRQNRIEGKFNCIPNPFPRMRHDWAGLEQKQYILCTASSKVGKSQITDYMFVYHPIEFILNPENNCQFDIEILYFSLEMSKQQKILQAISHFLYKFHGLKIPPKDLRSLENILDEDIINKIKEMEPFFQQFLSKIRYIDNIRNRYGIWREIFATAEKNGQIIYEEKEFDGKPVKVIKEYIPHNPNKIVIPLIDHVGLLNPESGKDLYASIGEFSSNDLVKARNLFGMSPIIIQQQMAAQENLEHKKNDALMPNAAGLADNKNTIRDIDVAFGLFSPARHNINNFKGYDIVKMQDRFRSIEILASREGGGNSLYPLLFYGECSYFEELPTPDKINYNNYI